MHLRGHLGLPFSTAGLRSRAVHANRPLISVRGDSSFLLRHHQQQQQQQPHHQHTQHIHSTARRLTMSQPGVPSSTAAAQSSSSLSSSPSPLPSFTDLDILNTRIATAPGVTLSPAQQVVVGSVLDLFQGRPSLKKLALWADDATFNDPLTMANGRGQFAAQWYGLEKAFSEIERLSYSVTSSGNPITMDMKTRYKVRGLGTEQTITSRIEITTRATDGRITKLEDKWDGSIPEGVFAKAWRNLNSVVVPAVVSVPKSEAEEEKAAQRKG